MRGMLAVLVVAGCEGAPGLPARLEPIGMIPQLFQDTPMAFDADDRLVIMDGSSMRRMVDDGRLDIVPGTQQFGFGSFGVDRDGTLLIGSNNSQTLARLEPGDVIVPIDALVPSTFTRPIGVPSGAYHVVIPGALNTLVLPAGTTTWVDSMRQLDRTVRAPDGTIYAIVDGDIVSLAADDSAVPIASCAELAGGICLDLQLAGTDAEGHVHMGLRSMSGVHVLDPVEGTYRDLSLPGGLRIEAMTAGAAMTLVIALDPARDERSIWLLLPGGDELLRFATLAQSLSGFAPQVLSDRAGNGYVVADTQVSRVVPN